MLGPSLQQGRAAVARPARVSLGAHRPLCSEAGQLASWAWDGLWDPGHGLAILTPWGSHFTPHISPPGLTLSGLDVGGTESFLKVEATVGLPCSAQRHQDEKLATSLLRGPEPSPPKGPQRAESGHAAPGDPDCYPAFSPLGSLPVSGLTPAQHLPSAEHEASLPFDRGRNGGGEAGDLPEATQHEGQPEPKLPGPACAGSLLRVQGPRRKDARRGLQNGDRPCVAGQLDLGSRKPRAPAGKRPASAWSAERWRRAARRLPSLSRPPAGLPRAPMGSPGFPKPGRLLRVPALCSHPTACPRGHEQRERHRVGVSPGPPVWVPRPPHYDLG